MDYGSILLINVQYFVGGTKEMSIHVKSLYAALIILFRAKKKSNIYPTHMSVRFDEIQHHRAEVKNLVGTMPHNSHTRPSVVLSMYPDPDTDTVGSTVTSSFFDH
jgi:hypothetical protein